ncbi:CPBP family intramembrane glutamic endopeptidase [Streptosporangium sp. NPDC000396]|uniref:CPBP family intramembrane glutamic endopeptidase n=1 Tax=Streptosporangium sp. NPDC000396 TaxID=3366185 RepID=UPI0036BD84DD
MKPLLAVLATIAFLFVSLLGSAGFSILLLDQSSPLFPLVFHPGVTLIALAVVYLYRRFVIRRPWSGLRLTWTWSAIPQTLLGVAVGMVAIATANAASVALGVADWIGPQADVPLPQGDVPLYVLLPTLFAVIVLGQAFPEEVLFRGHLFDALSAWLSPRAVLAVSAVAFGSIHILSQSAASGIGEKLLYVVQAVGLGLACGAARARTGAVWMAVGVHTGLHIARRVFTVESGQYGVQLVLEIIALALAAALVLLSRPRKAVAPAPS